MSELSKRIPFLFLLVAVLSFITGGVTGAYFASQNNKAENKSFLNDLQNIESQEDEEAVESTELQGDFDSEETSDKILEEDMESSQKIERYKEMLKKSMNNPSKEVLENFGVVIKSFSQSNRANDEAIELKKDYNWNVAVYPIDDSYKVIVGPFSNKKSAEMFLSNMPKLSKFIGSKIIKLPQADSF